MLLAIIKTGGKQYKVQEGDTLRVEKLAAGVVEKNITFDEVLLLGRADGTDLQIGLPTIKGAQVTAAVLEQGRAKKVVVRKFKAKSRYARKYGHRQPFTKVKITAITPTK